MPQPLPAGGGLHGCPTWQKRQPPYLQALRRINSATTQRAHSTPAVQATPASQPAGRAECRRAGRPGSSQHRASVNLASTPSRVSHGPAAPPTFLHRYPGRVAGHSSPGHRLHSPVHRGRFTLFAVTSGFGAGWALTTRNGRRNTWQVTPPSATPHTTSEHMSPATPRAQLPAYLRHAQAWTVEYFRLVLCQAGSCFPVARALPITISSAAMRCAHRPVPPQRVRHSETPMRRSKPGRLAAFGLASPNHPCGRSPLIAGSPTIPSRAPPGGTLPAGA